MDDNNDSSSSGSRSSSGRIGGGMCSAAEAEQEVDASLQEALLQSSLSALPFFHVIDDENGNGVCFRLGTVPTVKKKKKRKWAWSGGRRAVARALFSRDKIFGGTRRSGTTPAGAHVAGEGGLPPVRKLRRRIRSPTMTPPPTTPNFSRGVGSCEQRTIRSVCTNVRGSRDAGAGNDAELRSCTRVRNKCARTSRSVRPSLHATAAGAPFPCVVSLWICGS
jgi:hypothetical protein